MDNPHYVPKLNGNMLFTEDLLMIDSNNCICRKGLGRTLIELVMLLVVRMML